MDDATTIVDTYLAMWNETDPRRRVRLIEQAWVERITGFFGEAPALAGV